MTYLTVSELAALNFRRLGRGVKISDKASIYDHSKIEIGDYSRIDDFCVVSGNVVIGRNVHLAVYSHIAGGRPGVAMGDFSGLAYGCQIFAQSDDYTGKTLTNPTIPAKYKNETAARVVIGRHCIIGANSIVMPGVEIGEGSSIGAMSMVMRTVEPWSIYAGVPARRLRERSRDLLALERAYLADLKE